MNLCKMLVVLMAMLLLCAVAWAEGTPGDVPVGSGGMLLPGSDGYDAESPRFSTVPGCPELARRDVVSIDFLSDLSGAPEDAWDMSAAGDGSVLAWSEARRSRYALFIAADGPVRANPDSARLFAYYTNLREINFNGALDTSAVTDMSHLFRCTYALAEVDLSAFDTSSVTDMNNMFEGSFVAALDLSGFDTSRVTSMESMFDDCWYLTELDLSAFDTSSVTNMDFMFFSCTGLTKLNLSSFDTSSVTTMTGMFSNCSALPALDLSSFDVSGLTTMNGLFYGCEALTTLNLSSFHASGVTAMANLFAGCASLSTLTVPADFNLELAAAEGYLNNCPVKNLNIVE